MLKPVWEAFRNGLNVSNISADDLAYVYESTLVTPQARAQFGTHSTPRHIADFVLDRFKLWEFGAKPPKIYEPFAGAGVFLGSALRQMRDGLPHNWTDEQRHNLLVHRIGGSEIDPFACEVAKLSLILADYPNANGWLIEEADLFAKGSLATRLEDKDVILCNPPFEAFTKNEQDHYPEACAIDGSKAVFALETALQAKPNMLGFVVPNTLLVDRRYREQRREVEKLYSEVELVSLPDGVFNVSQLDTALLIARDLRSPNDSQIIRSSAVYDADKKSFAVNRTASHTIEEHRKPVAIETGDLWTPPLGHIWKSLSSLPKLGELVRGHWGIRWHGGQKDTNRVFDEPAQDRAPGYMNSSSLDQFVLLAPRYLDVRPESIYGGANYDWAAPKILTNAGRLSRGYWRLAAAVDRSGARASQQFIAFWPADDQDIDLDVVAALLNGPVVNAFLTEHSFDKRFRIGTLERAPIPKNIPQRLGELSREYTAAVCQEVSNPKHLIDLVNEIDALTIGAYELSDDLERDLYAAIGTSERPLRGAVSRRKSRQSHSTEQRAELTLFVERPVEEDIGKGLGRVLSSQEASQQLHSISHAIPMERWAGRTLTGTELAETKGITLDTLSEWLNNGRIVGFSDDQSINQYPLEQFIGNSPVAGLDEVVDAIGEPRVAWLWLRQAHFLLDQRRPIDVLKADGIKQLRTAIARDFS